MKRTYSIGETQKRVYISLVVYNYDCDSRYQTIQHNCDSIEQAKNLVDELKTLNIEINMKTKNRYLVSPEMGRTGEWLERNYDIFGFIESVEGIFQETTERIL